MLFLHLLFSKYISLGGGTFELLLSTLEPEISVGLTNFTGFDFLCLFLVVTFFGVQTKIGAVISLHAEASRPSLLGAVSGVEVTSD